MKRNFLLGLCLCCFVCGQSFGQQLPHYTQYVLNTFILNPAVAGIENYTDIKFSHRHQWVGIDGAPVTTYFTINAPLHKSDYDRQTALGFHSDNENPRGSAYWQEYEKADPHAGIGFTMLNDRTGPLNRFAAYGTYAYHLGIAPRTSIAAGISAGVKNTSLKAGDLKFADPGDLAVSGGGFLNKVKPEMNLGVWLYSANYFVGLSAQNIIGNELSYAKAVAVDTIKRGKLVPHLFLTTGYRYFLGDDVSFLPSILFKYIASTPFSFDVNAKVQYRDIVWTGLSFRYQDSWSAMVGININNAVNFGYAYDITTSKLNTVSHGSHEIVIGFLLNNKFGDWCPRNLF